MNTNKLFKIIGITTLSLIVTSTTANAQADVTLSGGNGTPLTIQLHEEITFINVPTGKDLYGFVLVGAAENDSEAGFLTHSGTIKWNETGDMSRNGGMGSRDAGESENDNIEVFWAGGNHPSTQETMTLSAGTRTTDSDSRTKPILGRGKYEIRMVDQQNNFIGNAGVQVPLVSVTLSGGNGEPLSVHIPREITFENVQTNQRFYGFRIIDAAQGNIESGFQEHSGTISWNNSESSGSGLGGLGSLEDNSITVFWSLGGGQPRTTQTMTLNPGTTTTKGPSEVNPIQGTGRYKIRMIKDSTNFIGEFGKEQSQSQAQETKITFVDFNSETQMVTLALAKHKC